MSKQQWELIPLSIKYLGMSAKEIDGVLYFRADEVEYQFSKGMVVYGMGEYSGKHKQRTISTNITQMDTHCGILLGYSEIEKPKAVSKEEIKTYLITRGGELPSMAHDLLTRIKLHGVDNG